MKLYVRQVLPILALVIIPALPENITGFFSSEQDQIKTIINKELGAFLRKGKDFKINDLKGSDGLASGTITFFDASALLTVEYTSVTQLQNVNVKFTAPAYFKNREVKKLIGDNLSKILPDGAEPPITELNLDFDNSASLRSLSALTTISAWTPILGSPISVKQPSFVVTATNPAAKRPSIMARMSATINFGGIDAKVVGTGNSTNTWNLKGSITELNLGNLMSSVVGSSMGGLQVPSGVNMLGINTLDFSIAPQNRSFIANGASMIGDMSMRFETGETGHTFLVGISPPEGFKYATLDQDMAFLDDLRINNSVMALSSEPQAANGRIYDRVGKGQQLSRGLNLMAAYDITSISPELARMIGKTDLIMHATVSNRPADMVFSTTLNTNINLDERGNVIFKDISMKMRPSDVSISMQGSVEIKAGSQVLTLISGMELDVKALAFTVEGQMNGTWSNPFGLSNGVHIQDLGLEVGASFSTLPIPLPALALQGTLKAGNVDSPAFEGSVAVGITPYDPINSMIEAKFNSLSLGQLTRALAAGAPIPTGVQGVLDQSRVSNVELTIVPNPAGVTLFDKSYDPGFLVKGSAQVTDFSADLLLRIEPNSGVEAKASVSAIELSPVFSLRGVDQSNPYLHLVLKPGIEGKLAVSGKATILGISTSTDMHIRDTGFDLQVSGEIFNAFQATLDVHANSARSQASYYVEATLQNDLHKYLTENTSAEIDRATKGTQAEISKAQADISIEQQKIGALNNDITRMRTTVQTERDRDCQTLRNAEADVERERQKVLKIQNDIDWNHAEIAKINNRINDKELWVKAAPNSAEEGVRRAEFVAFAAAENAKKTPFMTSIAALETAKGTANLALLSTTEIVKGMANLCDITPIDTDPRIASLLVTKETANTTMEAAKAILDGANIVGVGTLQASKWIVENGNPLGVVNIDYAFFEGAVGTVNGGTVMMRIKGTFAGKPLDTSFPFSFYNTLQSASDLANQLLK